MASFNPAGNNNSPDSLPQAGPLGQAKGWWDATSVSTRIITFGLAILVVLCFAGAIMLATEPEYTDLFNNLDPTDSAAIAQKLDDDHEKYQVADNDTTIRVPAPDKDRLRLEMTREGLPAKSGSVVSSDWLDKIGISTPSDVQNQYIQMAQESELSQTISSMNEVSSAAVHISPGNNSPFAGNDTPPSASVVIGLKPGMQLTSDQTMGIANLVSKAVTGLDLKNIAIMDTDGNQLWDGSNQTGPTGLASNRLTAEHLYSEDMRRQMQTYLDDVLGPRKAIVSVQATLDYDQVHKLETKFINDGKNPTMISQQKSDENYKSEPGSAAPPVKPSGIAGNTVPTYNTATTTGTHTGTYDHASSIVNFQPDKTETETQQAPGTVQSLRVAVLVDSATVDPSTQAQIKDYLETLAGINPSITKPDPDHVVTIAPFPFSNTAEKLQLDETKKAQAQEKIHEFSQYGAVAVIAIVMLVIFMKSSKSALRTVVGTTQSPNELVEGFIPQGHLMSSPDASQFPEFAQQSQLNGGQMNQYQPGLGSTMERVADEPVSIEEMLDDVPVPRRKKKKRISIDGIEEHVDVKLESVREMVQDSPETVALLMKGWITNDLESSAR